MTVRLTCWAVHVNGGGGSGDGVVYELATVDFQVLRIGENGHGVDAGAMAIQGNGRK